MSFRSKIYNLFYESVCRFYSKHIIGDKPADAIYRFLCSIQFFKTHHFWPNLKTPKRFSEMIVSSMLHNRSPLLVTVSDKLAVRDYITAKGFGEFLIPLLWKGTNPEDIPFQGLPDKFVIKATHGCGYNIIVPDKNVVDITAIKAQLNIWLKENYCDEFKIGIEWGYKNIQPSIIIEEFIGAAAEPPADYKFYCFNHRVEVCTIHLDRFKEHKTISVDRDFKPHIFHYHLKSLPFDASYPPNYSKLVSLAESLAVEFDFMRVDLYDVNRKIYFGELSPYPGGVSATFLPAEIDMKFGELWKNAKKINRLDSLKV